MHACNIIGVLIAGVVCLNVGCGGGDMGGSEPKRITVQHVLIGFQGSVRGKPITRSRAEAEALAQQVLEKAQSGEYFDGLVKQYTDDGHPGIYRMVNYGLPSNPRAANPLKRTFGRDEMVGAFGNVGFLLDVDEVGMAPHDPIDSPYGWHIIKRIK